MFALEDTFELSDRSIRVLFVDRPKTWSHGQLANELYDDHRPTLLQADYVVVREPVDSQATAAEIKTLPWTALLERIPNCGLLVLYSNRFQHRISKNLNPKAGEDLSPQQKGELLARLQQREIRHFVESSNALLRVTHPWILRLPSNKYGQEFLRVGSIQTNKPALDAIFFWMLPHLKDCTVILTETWTISSLSLNVSRLLANYRNTAPCRVDMLSRYHNGAIELRAEMKAAFERAELTEGRILFLMSASMSGRLQQQCLRALDLTNIPVNRVSFLSLIKLNDKITTDHLCDLSDLDLAFQEETEVDFTNRQVIEIDRTTFFPQNMKDRPVLISQDKQPKESGSEALEAYKGSGWLSLHRDSKDSGGQTLRHHCIYFDVPKLFAVPRFDRGFQQILVSLDPPPKLIITPPHKAGEQLAAKAAQILEIAHGLKPPITHTHGGESDGANPELSLLKELGEEDSIMILDDVSITGEQLSSLQASLRRLEYRGRIHYVIGIARPPALTVWNDRIRKLKFRKGYPEDRRHTVNSVERIVMPDWRRKQCPWCRELKLYLQLAQYGIPLVEDLVERLQLLDNQDDYSLLGNDAFLRAKEDNPLELTTNSILLNTGGSHADLIAAVANRVQRMRTGEDADRLTSGGFPEHDVLCSSCYFGNTFNDSVIRAAVLRVTTRPELEFSEDEAERARRELTVSILTSEKRNESDLSCEILLASASGHLPPLSLTEPQWKKLESRPEFAILKQLFQGASRDL